MTRLLCSPAVLTQTIGALRDGGARRQEKVVLWLAGASSAAEIQIFEVFDPMQRAAVDYFHIPPEGMRALMQHLRQTRQKVVAQVHSHPGRAFHSEADDTWAIVRHRGALSLVLPDFASTTDVHNFLTQAAVFQLSDRNSWDLIPQPALGRFLEVTQ